MSAARSLIAAAVLVLAMGVGLLVAIRHPDTATPATTVTTQPPSTSTSTSTSTSADASARAPDTDVAGAAAARDERDKLLERLADSGRADEVWIGQANALFDTIGRAPVETHVIGCFVAGCGATFTFASLAAYRDRIAEVEPTEVYRAWTGGKRFTAPEVRVDGSVIVGLVLYRPD